MTLNDILKSSDTVPEKISRILRECNIRPNLLGYSYIRETLIHIHLGLCDVHSVTKSMYPTVAKYMDTTPERVERAMRHAISSAWSLSRYEKSDIMEELFRVSARHSGKPTNSEFIATLADVIAERVKS